MTSVTDTAGRPRRLEGHRNRSCPAAQVGHAHGLDVVGIGPEVEMPQGALDLGAVAEVVGQGHDLHRTRESHPTA